MTHGQARASTCRQGPSFAQSFRELSLAQKGKKGVPLYCLYVNRPAGRVVAAALRNTRFGPNQVTFAGAFLTYGACCGWPSGQEPGLVPPWWE